MIMDCDKRKDPVAKLVRDCSAAEMVEWLVKYKSLDPNSAENVEVNLREQFRWHRLQGRLDQNTTACIIAELLLMRRSPMTLNPPLRQHIQDGSPPTDFEIQAHRRSMERTDTMMGISRALPDKVVIESLTSVIPDSGGTILGTLRAMQMILAGPPAKEK